MINSGEQLKSKFRGGQKLKIFIAINVVRLQINHHVILTFNLENFTCQTTSLIVTTGIAVIDRPLRFCMHNKIHMYRFSNQVVVACTLVIESFQ